MNTVRPHAGCRQNPRASPSKVALTTPVGTYEVEIREYSLCDDPDPATWTLEIRVEGELVETFNGVGGDQTVAFSMP